MQPVISVTNLSKTYATGFQALKSIDLEIRRGEIFALLGPNGAGKTTLISIICGIVNASGGTVTVDGHDHRARLPRRARLIGLVPQELHTDAFETVWATTSFSRGLFGKPHNPAYHREGAEAAVALGQEGQQDHDAVGRHEAPRADRQGAGARAAASCSSTSRPRASTSSCARTCGRWCASLRASGVTIILTTHYIEEAEQMADRIGVINKGELILVEEKAELMRKLGKKQLTLQLHAEARRDPGGARRRYNLALADRRARAGLHLRHAGRAHRHHALLAAIWRSRASASGTSTPRKARSRTSSSIW